MNAARNVVRIGWRELRRLGWGARGDYRDHTRSIWLRLVWRDRSGAAPSWTDNPPATGRLVEVGP